MQLSGLIRFFLIWTQNPGVVLPIPRVPQRSCFAAGFTGPKLEGVNSACSNSDRLTRPTSERMLQSAASGDIL